MAYLVTGVPGFIASRLVRALAAEGRPLYLLCERRFAERARAFAHDLGPLAHVVPGDITLPDLGLAAADLARVRAEVREVYHLAAIYDLAVPHALAWRVNVDGTERVVALTASIPGCRLSYVSTCYVAGDRTGVVYEDELERGQGFKNHYESTKYEAERIVRGAMDRIETRIFRPAVVIGDSRSGETDKLDGPYIAFRALRMGLLVLLPGPSQARLNLVPVDFVVRALAALPKQPGTAGRTFALADPEPLRARELMERAADLLGAPRPRGSVPAWLFKALLGRGGLARRLGIPIETVDYFNTEVRFDVRNTAGALAGTGIACPRLPSYLGAILAYYREKAPPPWTLA